MSAINVTFTVTDPDELRAGTSPMAPFAVRKIELYRYASEANARADSSATLVETFDLVASTTASEDPDVAGPWRYGFADEDQGAASWYRYRFGDDDLLTFSQLSEPWPARRRPGWALRDILFEVGNLVGGTMLKRTAASNSNANELKLTDPFVSTKRDARFFEGWWAICTEDAGGSSAAPEGEEALIDSVNTSTGVATLERSLGAAITTSDTVLLSALIQPTELIRIINRCREEMQFVATIDIALDPEVDRYPAPWGVRSESDVLDAVGVIQYANSTREDEFEIDYKVAFDGFDAWLELRGASHLTRLVRLRVLRNYRDAEGNLSAMGDTTRAPIEWLRPVVAHAMVEWLAEGDGDPEIQRLLGELAPKARVATGKFAPEVQRRLKTGGGRAGLPGPAEVW